MYKNISSNFVFPQNKEKNRSKYVITIKSASNSYSLPVQVETFQPYTVEMIQHEQKRGNSFRIYCRKHFSKYSYFYTIYSRINWYTLIVTSQLKLQTATSPIQSRINKSGGYYMVPTILPIYLCTRTHNMNQSKSIACPFYGVPKT